LLFGLGLPTQVVEAGLVGTMSLVFFGGVLIYHVLFKATLTIEREVLAELASVLVMIVLLRSITSFNASLPLIFVFHTLSRATFFVLCYLLGKAQFPLSAKGVAWSDVRWSLQTSSAIGTIGFIVILYESVDLLLLQRLTTLVDVAYYRGGQNYIAPIVATLATIGGTLYPVAAAGWPDSRGKFEQACQRAIDVVVALAGVAVTGILAGSDFLMRLLGPDLAPGAPVLRLLAVVLFFKAVSATLGPVLYIVRAETHALRMVGIALASKVVLILFLVPRFGYMGVAASALIVDFSTAVVTLYLLRQSSGFRLRWKVPIKAAAITAVAAFAPSLLIPTHGFLSAVFAVGLFVGLSFVTGTVRVSDVLPLLKWKTS
jgi:O-antigen/teichoic acid export membrane protein